MLLEMIHRALRGVISWDTIVFTGFVIAAVLALVNRPKDLPLSRAALILSAPVFLFFSITCGKIIYVLANWQLYFETMRLSVENALNAAGTDFFGTFPGQLLVILLFTKARIHRVSFLKAADFLIPYLFLAQAVSRIGCFVRGCCYGLPTALPWGVRFGADNLPRHPLQLYEFLYTLAIFIFVRRLYRKGAPVGEPFFLAMFLYGIMRFLSEFLDAKYSYIAGGMLTFQQFGSLILIIAGGLGLLYISRKGITAKAG